MKLLPKIAAWREGWEVGKRSERDRIYQALDSVDLNYVGPEGRGAAKGVMRQVRNLVDPIRWPSRYHDPDDEGDAA